MKEIEYEKPAFEEKDTGWEKKKKLQSSMPTVRTFRDDVQELIKEKGATKTEIALAEAARRESRGETRFPTEDDGPHLGRIIFILLLVLAFGLGVGGYALLGAHSGSLFGTKATSTPPTPTTEDIEVNIANSPREQVLADISIAFGKTFLPTGGERKIVFLIKDDGGTRIASDTEFFSAISDHGIPEALSVSLDNSLVYQVYSGSTLSGVITLHSRSYANSFAAMLDWEPQMYQELIPALDPLYDRRNIKDLRDRQFKDEQFMNVNMRVLYDLDGNPVLAYGFTDKRTLVISGNLDGLRASITQGAK